MMVIQVFMTSDTKVKELISRFSNFDKVDGVEDVVQEDIDELEKELPELHNFILPGGTSGAARVHLSRTICRRLERSFVKHFQDKIVGKKESLKFINRLSDLLFVLARYLNFNENVKDIIWTESDE